MKETIQYESDNREAWICLCGNTPINDGFYPINEFDREVYPTADEWTTNEYYCAGCGRVIDQTTLEVTRRIDLSKVQPIV